MSTNTGRQSGGKPFARGALYLLLQNKIYRGEIVHKETSYPGTHDAIIDEGLWSCVQDQLACNRHKERVGENNTAPSLLAGMIHDEKGAPLTPSHAVKKAKRYRYYVSRPLQQGASAQGVRVPAGDIEHIVTNRLGLFFSDQLELHNAIEPFVPDASEQQALFEKADTILGCWDTRSVQELRHIFLHLNAK